MCIRDRVKTNTDNIEALQGRVESLEGVTIVSISADKIRALFEQ